MKSETYYNAQHRKRIEKLTRQVYNHYVKAIQASVIMGLSVEVDPDKPFSFSDYPGLKTRVNNMMSNLYDGLITTVNAGTAAEWDWSNQKNDDLVKSLFGENMPKALEDRFLGHSLEALRTFQKRKTDGMDLSGRVWNYTEQFKGELEMALDVGLTDGRSAAQLSQDVRSYLNEPNKLSRRVRDKRGVLQLSKAAKNYHPGQGVYRSSYKNAMRLTRTEANMAYREADHNRWQDLDFVVGFQVHRSNNPYPCDVCESLQGKYPKTFKFKGWHPQCMCYVTSILATREEMDHLTEKILNGEDTDDFRSVNEVGRMPEGWNKWMRENEKRLLTTKSQPYFVRDNFTDGDVRKGLRFALAVPLPMNTAPKIDLSRLIKGDTPTNKEMASILNEYAERFPDNFRNGLGNVSFRSSRSYLMQHSMAYHPQTKKWVGQSSISVSTNTFTRNFNPSNELAGAFGAIKNGKELTFNQEYAMESMWHEILHAKTLAPPTKLSSYQVEKMETVNQFVARHTYNEFIEAFGGKASNKQDILENGLGYRTWVKNFRTRLQELGIPEQKAVRDLMPILMDDYAKLASRLEKYLQANATQ
jgi:hypothetical protein